LHCPDCGKSNPAGSAYCNSCGRKLPETELGTSVRCPYCGEPGQEYRFNCTKCGKELPRDSSGRPIPLEAEKGKKFCRMCGKELGPAVTRCPYCGTSLGDIWSPISQPAEFYGEDESYDNSIELRHESSVPIFAGVCLLLAGLAALGQGIIYMIANSIAQSVYGYDIGGSLCFCGGLDALFGLAAIFGAVMCFGRKSFVFALIGGILGMLGVGFLFGAVFGLVGLILVAVSKDEFEE
jgi:DNA-directed RNA polymerase subunit RPC12/RpoP